MTIQSSSTHLENIPSIEGYTGEPQNLNLESTAAPAQSIPDGVKYLLTQPELAKTLGVKNQSITNQAQKLEIKPTTMGRKSAFTPFQVRKIMEARGRNYKKQIISFQMLKGGSTKTTTAFNLAVRLNQYGAKVLVVDADPQGNMTSSFGYELNMDDPVLYHVISNQVTLEDTIKPISEGLDLIPSNYDNSSIDVVIQSKKTINIKTLVKSLIDSISDQYDFIIFDCNPALSSINLSIALASDLVIIPVNPDPYSKMGLEKVLEEYRSLESAYEKTVQYKLLYTLHDRENISRKYLVDYASNYEDKMFGTTIRRNADVKVALDAKRPIFENRKASALPDYDAFSIEVLDWPMINDEGMIGNA